MLSVLKSLSINGIFLKQLSINDVTVWQESVAYTNQVPISIDTDGNIYNGCGYKDSYRLSSSGVEKAGDNTMTATGFIPAKGNDVIRIGGISWYSGSGNAQNYLCAYDSSFKYIGSIYGQAGGYYTEKIHSSYELTTSLSTIVLADNSSIAYIRVNCRDDSNGSAGISGANMIVTINEEIS